MEPGEDEAVSLTPGTSVGLQSRLCSDASSVSRFTFHVGRSFILAWHFLTAVSLSRAHHEPTARELAGSMAWYPVIGLLIGGGLCLADLALRSLFDAGVVNVLLVVLLVLFTQGLHQDGLADTLDGLAGGRTAETRLPIMRDPRIGAIGATGLFLSLLVRYAGLMALPQELRIPALVCMPAVGRWVMVTLAWTSPYARPEGGLAAPFLTHLSWRQVVIATAVLAAGLATGFGVIGGLVVLTMGILVVLASRRAFRSWFGGITGDTLGAANEVVEILFLLLVPLLLRLS